MSVVSLSLFYIRRSRLDWEAPLSATAKLYSTTLLAVLNSRMHMITAIDNTVSWDYADLEAVQVTRSLAQGVTTVFNSLQNLTHVDTPMET